MYLFIIFIYLFWNWLPAAKGASRTFGTECKRMRRGEKCARRRWKLEAPRFIPLHNTRVLLCYFYITAFLDQCLNKTLWTLFAFSVQASVLCWLSASTYEHPKAEYQPGAMQRIRAKHYRLSLSLPMSQIFTVRLYIVLFVVV